MAVHASSKIDLWLNIYHPAFYVSITDKENWAYINQGDTPTKLAALEAYFTELMVRINTWRNTAWEGRFEEAMGELIGAIVSFKNSATRFGTSEAFLPDLDAVAIFNIVNFIPDTLARAMDYYNDVSVGGVSFKLQTDIDRLALTVWQAVEIDLIAVAIAKAKSPTKALSKSSMFEPLVSPVGATLLTKEQLANIVFIDLRYKFVKDNIPGVTGITIPPYIT